jgi:DNA processing protein
MTDYISADTQAILLLTARLGRSTRAESATPAEYNRVARSLHEAALRPAALLGGSEDSESIQIAAEVLGAERVQELLSRTLLLATEVSRWQGLGIWVVSRADEDYPRPLKSKLNASSPAIFFGAGDRGVLVKAGLGVVGSRNVDQEGLDFAEELGRKTVEAGYAVVSGGARGSDRAAMNGAIDAGGTAVGFLSDGLERAVSSGESRTFIEAGKLTLLSHVAPSDSFAVWRAMERNKFIYAQSFACVVVESENGKGGTWEGAKEQLKRLHFCPVFIRDNVPLSSGRAALEKLGAKRWVESSPAELDRLSTAEPVAEADGSEQSPAQLTLNF